MYWQVEKKCDTCKTCLGVKKIHKQKQEVILTTERKVEHQQIVPFVVLVKNILERKTLPTNSKNLIVRKYKNQRLFQQNLLRVRSSKKIKLSKNEKPFIPSKKQYKTKIKASSPGFLETSVEIQTIKKEDS